MLFSNTETDKINRIIAEGAKQGLTDTAFFAKEIAQWKKSQQRMEQIIGDAYYLGKHDILQRKRTVIGADGKLQAVENLTNNKVIDNQYAKMVDQKTNYLLGKPITFDCANKTYSALLKKRFDASFQRTMKYIGEVSYQPIGSHTNADTATDGIAVW